MAGKAAAKHQRVPAIVEDSVHFDDMEHPIFKEKFTVKDILRMFKLSLQGTLDEDSTDLQEDGGRLEMLLRMIREADTTEAVESLSFVRHDRRHSSQILIHQSDSATLQNLFAVSERVLEKKEVLVHPVVRAAYRRLLDFKVLPNSTLKRLPDTIPAPPPTWHQKLQKKVIKKYYEYYGPDKPRPDYPILPPRERPPPPPEPEPKKKKKKGKKGKKGGKKKKANAAPEQPFCMTSWRKENLPVASTRLPRKLLRLACYLPTPAYSPPPSPPTDVPEPTSFFGYFINNLGPDHLKKASHMDQEKSSTTTATTATLPPSARRHIGDVSFTRTLFPVMSSTSHNSMGDGRTRDHSLFSTTSDMYRKD